MNDATLRGALRRQTRENKRLRAALRNIRELNMTAEDENGHRWAQSDLIEQEIIVALMKGAQA